MKKTIPILMLILGFAIIACKNKDTKHTSSSNPEEEKQTNDSIIDTNIISDSIIDNVQTSSDYHTQYLFSKLHRRLYGNVKSVSSTLYYYYTEEDGQIIPSTEKANWYLYTIAFNEDGAEKSNDFGRNSGGVETFDARFDTLGNATIKYYIDWMSDDTINSIYCKYDNNSNLIKESIINYEMDSLRYYEIHEYDNNNNLLETCIYTDNHDLESQSVWKYNNNNNEIESYTYFTEGAEILYHYKYSYKLDTYGNWTHQIIYESDTITTIEVRIIDYY